MTRCMTKLCSLAVYDLTYAVAIQAKLHGLIPATAACTNEKMPCRIADIAQITSKLYSHNHDKSWMNAGNFLSTNGL